MPGSISACRRGRVPSAQTPLILPPLPFPVVVLALALLGPFTLGTVRRADPGHHDAGDLAVASSRTVRPPVVFVFLAADAVASIALVVTVTSNQRLRQAPELPPQLGKAHDDECRVRAQLGLEVHGEEAPAQRAAHGLRADALGCRSLLEHLYVLLG